MAADIATAAHRILDRRLNPDSRAPIAVALSGGGDSVALTLIAVTWAKSHGRPLLVLTVDHGLQAGSVQWTAHCQALASRLGAAFRALDWIGDKPTTGLPAAARQARHRLLANAARDAGASVILVGHTADDLVEAARMRAEGSTTPDPREWSPSPVWPEGRDLFLLRPLLNAGRAEIRAWLATQGEAWIDDPANDDLRYARARARVADCEVAEAAKATSDLSPLARATTMDAAGVLHVPRSALRDPSARPFIAMAALCAAGTSRPPRGDRLDRLAQALATDAPVIATLAGARIEADEAQVRFMRDAGEASRGGLAPMATADGVWDGRFAVSAGHVVTIRRLSGVAARLPKDQREALAAFTPKAREALPVLVKDDGVTCPVVAAEPGLSLRPLALDRLLAASGAVDREP